MIMKSFSLVVISLLFTSSVGAQQTITYTSFNDKQLKQQMVKHWKITEEEYQRYADFMNVEGRYRYKDLTPLEVLGIAAEDEATRQYYAKKAAIEELAEVKKQMEFILLTTQYKTEIYENDPEIQAQRAAAKKRLAEQAKKQIFKDQRLNEALKQQNEK